MMKILPHITSLLAFCFFTLFSLLSVAHAETVVLEGNNPNPIPLGPHYQVYVDDQHQLTIDDVLLPSSHIEFSPLLANNNFNLGLRQETLWFKVEVSNANASDIKQLLEFNFSLLDDLGIYIVNKESKRILSRFDTDKAQSFTNRLYQHSNFIFPITLPAKTEMTFYFRIQSKGNMTAGATLWQPNVFAEQDRVSYFLLTLYLGLLLALSIYNILLFISVRESRYLYYALFSSAMLLAVGAYNGIWFELLWPNRPQWQTISIPISFALCGLFAALFSRSFLQTKSNAPILDKVFLCISLAFISICVLNPYIDVTMSLQIIAICTLMLTFIASTTAIILSVKRSHEGLIYIISWLGLLAGAAIFSLQILGMLPSNEWTRSSIIAGSTLEMFILLCSLSLKITQLNKERNQSRQEIFQTHNHLFNKLRDKDRELLTIVNKRTATLAMANEYLVSQQEKNHDALTGLANVMLITEQIKLLLTQCERKKTKFAVLLLNVDKFKKINEEFGHEVGDKLLITIASRLRDNFRKSDIAARTNGDEFIILLDVENTARNAVYVAKKIKNTLAETTVIDGYAIQFNVSIGIAIYPDDGTTVDDLLSKATQAMYIDKGYITPAETLILE